MDKHPAQHMLRSRIDENNAIETEKLTDMKSALAKFYKTGKSFVQQFPECDHKQVRGFVAVGLVAFESFVKVSSNREDYVAAYCIATKSMYEAYFASSLGQHDECINRIDSILFSYFKAYPISIDIQTELIHLIHKMFIKKLKRANISVNIKKGQIPPLAKEKLANWCIPESEYRAEYLIFARFQAAELETQSDMYYYLRPIRYL